MLLRLASLRLRCFALLATLGIISCSSGGWRKLDKDEILSTLPELNLLMATLKERGATDSVRQRAYHEFFARRGYTLADWDSTVAWYAKHRVKLFHDYYRLTVDSLTRQRTQLEQKRDLIVAAQERERLWYGAMLDSVNLLQDSSAYYFGGELINKTFELIPSTPYRTSTEVYVEALLLGLKGFPTDSLSLELRLHLSDTTSVVRGLQMLTSGHYTISAQVPEGKQVVRVTGGLRGVLHHIDTAALWVAPLRCYKYSSEGSSGEQTDSSTDMYQDASEDLELR